MTSRADLTSILNVIIRVGGQIILLPLILRKVETDAIGLWYTFSAVTSFSLVFDVLLSGSITRLAAAYRSGMPKKAIGIFKQHDNGTENRPALLALIGTSRFTSLTLGVTYAALLLPIGKIWLISSIAANEGNLNIQDLWFLCVTASAIGLAYGQSNNIIRGLNAIATANQHIITSYTTQALLTALLLWMECGILSLAIGAAFGPIITEFQGQAWLKKNNMMAAPIPDADIIRSLAPSGLRLAGVYFGGYLFTQALTLTAAQKLSLETAAKLGLSLQILKIISTISGVFGQNRAPEITRYIIQNDPIALRASFKTAFTTGIICLIISSALVLLFGNSILNQIGSQTQLLPTIAISLLIILKIIEYVADQFTTLVTSSNHIPFAIPSLLSGTLLYCLTKQMNALSITSLLLAAIISYTCIKGAHAIFTGITFIKSKK